MLFIFFLSCASNENCTFSQTTELTQKLLPLSQTCRGILANFGLNVSLNFTSVDAIMNDPMPYLFGVAGYAALFLILALLLIIYFLIGAIIACCPCMHAKKSKKCTLMGSIPHIIASALCAIGIVLFFFSATHIAKGLKEAAKIPNEVNVTFSSVDDTINVTVDTSFSTIDSSISEVGTSVKTLIDLVGNNLDGVKKSVQETQNSIKGDKTTFQNDVSEHLKKLNEKIKDAQCYGQKLNIDVMTAVNGADTAFDTIIKSIDQLSGSFDQIEKLKDEAQKAANDVLDNQLKGEIDKYKQQIPELTKSFTDLSVTIQEPVDQAGTYIDLINSYVNPVTWGAVGVLSFIFFIFLVAYFFNNCFGRCVASTFCIWSLLLIIIIGIPSFIFAILYVVFNDVCPVLEDTAASFVGDALPKGADIEGMLKCPETLVEKDLYRLLKLNTQFDYKQIIGEVAQQAQQSIDSINDPDLIGKLEEAAQLDPAADINISEIFKFDLNGLTEKIDKAKNSGCTGITDGYGEDISNAQKGIETVTAALQKTLEKSTNFQPFLRDIPSAVTNAIGSVENTLNFLTKGLEGTIDNAVDSLDCNLVCTIYAPAKNALCVHVVDGSTFWQLSAVFFALGLTVMSCAMCQRRKVMGSPKVKQSDQDSEEEDSDFSSDSK